MLVKSNFHELCSQVGVGNVQENSATGLVGTKLAWGRNISLERLHIGIRQHVGHGQNC